MALHAQSSSAPSPAALHLSPFDGQPQRQPPADAQQYNPTAPPTPTPSSGNMNVVTEWLACHGVVFSELLQDLLRKKPDNPSLFLLQRLCEEATQKELRSAGLVWHRPPKTASNLLTARSLLEDILSTGGRAAGAEDRDSDRKGSDAEQLPSSS